MKTPRVHPAYSPEIVVSNDQMKRTCQIVADGPGHVATRAAGAQAPGWVRMVLTTESEQQMVDLETRLRQGLDFHLVHCEDRVLARSRGGKTHTSASVALHTPEDLALAYTPGVGRVSQLLAQSPKRVNELTGTANRVAVVADGSAVLGLGNLGPLAALPVMEGKAALFARLAGIDAVPICLATQDANEIVSAVTAIAPGFGGINLEDISAPRCFEVEKRLRDALDIPVVHDDQHGTAIVVLAALLNALRIVSKRLETARIVIVGAGAAGTAVTRLLLDAGAQDVTVWVPDNAAAVRIRGPLAFPEAVAVSRVIKHVIELHPSVVLLNLTEMHKVDATGIAVLVGIGGDLKTANIQVRVIAADPRIRYRLPHTLGLRKIFPTVEEALRYEP